MILVFLFHADKKYFAFGYLGVDVFICLSGFVIIKVINESDFKQRSHFVIFLRNRVRRIYPLLAIFLVIQLLLSLIFQPVLPNPKFTIFSLLGLGNFYFARVATNYWNIYSETPWNLHSWSIALELQFYLTLACIVFFTRNTRFRLSLISILFIMSLYFYFHSKSNGQYPYLIFERFWEFCIGIAVYHACRSKIVNQVKHRKTFVLSLITLLALSTILSADARIVTLLLCSTILIFDGILPKFVLENKVMQFMGLISYSFLCGIFLLLGF